MSDRNVEFKDVCNSAEDEKGSLRAASFIFDLLKSYFRSTSRINKAGYVILD